MLGGKAKNVDPGQIAQHFEHSDLGLHCLHVHFIRKVGAQNFRTATVNMFCFFFSIFQRGQPCYQEDYQSEMDSIQQMLMPEMVSQEAI